MFEIIIDFILHYLHFDFLKEKRKKRTLEKNQNLPKQTMIHPHIKIYGILTLIIFSFLTITWFYRQNYSNKNDCLNALSQIEILLEKNKQTSGVYPESLNEIIRNNPLRKNINIDLWGNEYYYKTSNKGLKYVLSSKGKDGIINTKDDIATK